MKVFKHTCHLVWKVFRGSQLSALDKLLLWPTFCIYTLNCLLLKNFINWWLVYMIWPTLGQAEVVGEGMKNVGLGLNCITRVYTFEKKWEVNKIGWHLKVCSYCNWSDKWLCSWKTSTFRTSCTLYQYCTSLYYSTSLKPTWDNYQKTPDHCI